MAWAGIIDDQVIGPFFFERNVDGNSYSEMLTNYLLPELRRRNIDPMSVCYQHDGAPAHISAGVRQILDENFMSWIGRGVGTGNLCLWPPRSPDLNPLDFFLWGVLQHRVHLIEHPTIEAVEESVIREIQTITPEMLERVHLNLKKRLFKCIEVNGELFEYLLK